MEILKKDKKRVLLVDDNQTFLRVVADFLRRHNELTIVGAVTEGEEALAQVRALEPHVVLLDLDMPGLSGIEVIPRIQSVAPQVKIVVLTLLDGSIYRQAALKAGADAFVAKANLSTDLLPAIRRVTPNGQISNANPPGEKGSA